MKEIHTNHRSTATDLFKMAENVARTAADLESTLTWLKVRLVDQLPVCRLATHQLVEGVVEGKQPVTSGRGDVGSISLGHLHGGAA